MDAAIKDAKERAIANPESAYLIFECIARFSVKPVEFQVEYPEGENGPDAIRNIRQR
jgi:hypothetical protein